MHRNPKTLFALLALTVCAGAAAPALSVAPEDDAEVDAILVKALRGKAIPGAVAAIARHGSEPRVAAWGVRKAGDDAPITSQDAMHIGSDTKAMTAVLIARLVQQDKIGWQSTISDVLPDLAEGIHPAYGDVTVLQLLRHTSGAPGNAKDWRAFSDLAIRERRVAIAAASMQKEPRAAPGAGYLYSNLGYMVAGAMLEAACDATWEELIQQHVFEPLGMEGAGFGVPGTKGETDAPWGHRVSGDDARPIQGDNDAALGPAGTVYLPIESWARFALQFTDTAAKDDEFLSKASRRQLLEVDKDDYACGWMVVQRPWAGGTALSHSGSNTMWFATAWIAPKNDTAYLVAVNAAGDGVGAEVDRLIGDLIRLDLSSKSKRGR
ncbi:MAG: serine hydrolase domain-containing protein [Planctomycetota bacterium]